MQHFLSLCLPISSHATLFSKSLALSCCVSTGVDLITSSRHTESRPLDQISLPIAGVFGCLDLRVDNIARHFHPLCRKTAARLGRSIGPCHSACREGKARRISQVSLWRPESLEEVRCRLWILSWDSIGSLRTHSPYFERDQPTNYIFPVLYCG